MSSPRKPIFRRKPWWLFFTGPCYVCLAPVIYSPRGRDIQDDPAALAHELRHFERQEETGLALWLLRYCLSRWFRFQEEVDAYALEVALGLQPQPRYWVPRIAAQLASWQYAWAAKSKRAAEVAIWREVDIHKGRLSRKA